jgi:hypothetical protein
MKISKYRSGSNRSTDAVRVALQGLIQDKSAA